MNLIKNVQNSMQKMTKCQRNRLKLSKKMDMYAIVIYWKANIVKLSSLHKLIYKVNANTVWWKLTS